MSSFAGFAPQPLETATGARFTVARAHRKDLPALVALLRDDPLGADREGPDLAPYDEAFAAIDADPHQLLIAVRPETLAHGQAELAATLQLTLIPGLSRGGATRLQIEAVRVAAAYRGAGLGSALFDWAHREGARRGARLAQLTTDRSRRDAHRFYLELGYQASHDGMKRDLGDLAPPTGHR